MMGMFLEPQRRAYLPFLVALSPTIPSINSLHETLCQGPSLVTMKANQ